MKRVTNKKYHITVDGVELTTTFPPLTTEYMKSWFGPSFIRGVDAFMPCEICEKAGTRACNMDTDGRLARDCPYSTRSDKGDRLFRCDKVRYAVKCVNRWHQIAAYAATFKRIKSTQILFDRDGRATFLRLPKDKRYENSRGGERIDNKGPQGNWTDTWDKFCEQCGARFTTSNERRLFCDACHDEICDRLGFSTLAGSGCGLTLVDYDGTELERFAR